MREQYPFFREEDERTAAVIGEEAASSDLEGTYKKPYAILTQKRLYCKNERGNFIIGTDQLLRAGISQNDPPFTWLLWAAFGVVTFSVFWLIATVIYYNGYYDDLDGPLRWVLGVICLVIFLITRKKFLKAAPISLCIFSGYWLVRNIIAILGNYGVLVMELIYCTLCFVLTIVFVIVYYIKSRDQRVTFEILHTGGAFAFPAKSYPAGELKQFAEQVKLMQSGVADGK